jgi:hypothetical protein
LLLLLQTAVVFREKAGPAETTASSTPAEARPPSAGPGRGVEYLSGLLGLVLVGAGGYVLAQASRKSKREQLEEDRREEDRSFGRQGHHVSTPTIWKER